MSIFGTTGICESFMPIFVLFAKDSVEWPETGKQGGDLPLQRGQKYRNNGKSSAPKRRGGQKAAVGLQRGKRLPKTLPQKRRGKRRAFCGVRTRKLCRKIWQKRAAGCVAAAWRPKRTPAFRRVAFGLLLRFCCFAVLPLVAPLPRAGRHFLCLTGLCILAALRYTYFNHNTQPPGTVRGCAGEGSRNKTEPGLPRREGSHHAVYH